MISDNDKSEINFLNLSMRKITFLFGLFSLIGCSMELEKPLMDPYGIYTVESMVSSIPVDFSDTGEQITEHAASFLMCGPGEFSIEWRLNKQTPIMDFDTFMFWDWFNPKTEEWEIIKGCGFSRRIVNQKENGDLELMFYGGEGAYSTNPKSFLSQFEVLSLDYFPEDKSIRMETRQQVYDFFTEEYVETEIDYLFYFSGPVFPITN
ncbi:hypothetical protein [Algoriphagus pacificus]|uniref:Lipoprotein n=1 Tax=Algoriphagus pacificus TaxID=2811234 RepID=A0ABS3CK74_9BACT|nr:hypothetical protein [Algoriphagus pacificus]MBN7816881.1 hypothetical protein [Algoriphagus pacificus]